MIWLLKVTVTPLLIAAATLVMRKFGPRIGGLLLGFPLMAGPISVFFAIEQGAHFATVAAKGTLLAIASVAGYCSVYGLLAPRASWTLSLLGALTAFVGISLSISYLDVSIAVAGGVAYCAIGLALAALRMPAALPALGAPPWWDLWVRMATSAALVAAVTLAADQLGPTWSGIAGAFPVITTVAICFMHAQWGHEAAVIGLRGILLSLFSFVSFFIAVAVALPRVSLIGVYALGTGAAIATSLAVLGVERRMPRRRAPQGG